MQSEISYNHEIETYFAKEAERCQGLAWLHSKAAEQFLGSNTYLALPIIVLSTLSGTVSSASANIFTDAKIASMSVGALSIFIGVLGTFQSYFGLAKRAEAHRITGLMYAKLNQFLGVELTLKRSERILAKDLLKMVREQSERLLETGPPVPQNIIDKFKKEFVEKYPNVAIPDIANGLRSIYINNTEEVTRDEVVVVVEKEKEKPKVTFID
jgi:hypothetical protein